MELLTLDQTAEKIGTTRRTLNRWIRRKRIAVVRFGYRTVRVRPADLARFMERCTEGAR